MRDYNTTEERFVDFGMTMRELLRSIPFESISKVIVENGEEADLNWYKNEYKTRLTLEAAPCRHDIYLPLDEDTLTGEKTLSAFCLEGEYVCDYIDGDIYIPDGLIVSKEELARVLLSEGESED